MRSTDMFRKLLSAFLSVCLWLFRLFYRSTSRITESPNHSVFVVVVFNAVFNTEFRVIVFTAPALLTKREPRRLHQIKRASSRTNTNTLMNKVTWKEASKRPKFNDTHVSVLPGRFSHLTSISNHKQPWVANITEAWCFLT